jgi:hypothetical protein
MKLEKTSLERLAKAKADIVAQDDIAKREIARKKLSVRPQDHPAVVAERVAVHKAHRLHCEFVREASFAMTRLCAGYGDKTH